MVYLIVFSILVFDFVIIRMASRCSRIEEKMYLEKVNEKDIKVS